MNRLGAVLFGILVVPGLVKEPSLAVVCGGLVLLAGGSAWFGAFLNRKGGLPSLLVAGGILGWISSRYGNFWIHMGWFGLPGIAGALAPRSAGLLRVAACVGLSA
ncbi:MAG: hypothetical protein AB1758_30025, partial [Candidatus Eremiobacterota bacterium]